MPDSDLFIATEEEARAGGEAIPYPKRLPDPTDARISVKNIFSLELSTLWPILRGEIWSSEQIVKADFPLLYQGSEEGPWVQEIPQDLYDRLSVMDAPYIASASLAWHATDELKHAEWEGIRDCLTAMVTLAKHGKRTGKGLYLWTSL